MEQPPEDSSMEQINVKNFRCFCNMQTVRLAPLTLIVGENSTGKTSFMALIRALWDVAYGDRVPDFKEDPYDLGSFDEIAHHRGAKGGRAETFEAGFYSTRVRRKTKGGPKNGSDTDHFSVTFGKIGTVPAPVVRRFDRGKLWIEEHFGQGNKEKIRIGTPRGSWEFTSQGRSPAVNLTEYMIRPLFYSIGPSRLFEEEDTSDKFVPLNGSPKITREDLIIIERFVITRPSPLRTRIRVRPYASAPVRSKPRRTYDPDRSSPDSEGDYVPMYLASLYFQNKNRWGEIQDRLQRFGRAAGLFDEISIRTLGSKESEPFQVQVRKYGGKLKGPRRNLIDVGYGVSQVLPVITELLRHDSPTMFLLQQPEVHLHPSAQAALGSFWCEVGSWRRQLIVETHSDHLLDRVRMDVRDGRGRLKPDDVSILFFERDDLDVHIHSLRLDKRGNVLGAPASYRRFFMEETTRSLGL